MAQRNSLSKRRRIRKRRGEGVPERGLGGGGGWWWGHSIPHNKEGSHSEQEERDRDLHKDIQWEKRKKEGPSGGKSGDGNDCKGGIAWDLVGDKDKDILKQDKERKRGSAIKSRWEVCDEAEGLRKQKIKPQRKARCRDKVVITKTVKMARRGATKLKDVIYWYSTDVKNKG